MFVTRYDVELSVKVTSDLAQYWVEHNSHSLSCTRDLGHQRSVSGGSMRRVVDEAPEVSCLVAGGRAFCLGRGYDAAVRLVPAARQADAVCGIVQIVVAKCMLCSMLQE